MISGPYLQVLVWLFASLWAALLILSKTPLPDGFFKPISMVVSITGLLLFALDRWLWRITWLHPWLVQVPDLRGTWEGEIISNWVNPETGQPPSPIKAFFRITQNLSTIQMRLMTKESQSELIVGSVKRTEDGIYVVTGIYRNTPKMSHREGSPIHHGGILLEAHGTPPRELDGQYWTDRKTCGEMRFNVRDFHLYDSFDDASVHMCDTEQTKAPRAT